MSIGIHYIVIKDIYDDCMLACHVDVLWGMNVEINGIDITDTKSAVGLIEKYALNKNAKVTVVDESRGYSVGNVILENGYDLAEILVLNGAAVWST